MISEWQEFRATLNVFSDAEWEVIDHQTRIINEIIRERYSNNITQEELGLRSGIPHHIIVGIEDGSIDPEISILIKIFKSLGKIITIVDDIK